MKFEISAVKHDGEEEVLSIDSNSILSALEASHKLLQLKAGLGPNQYKIVAASRIYPSSSAGAGEGVIRQGYDIPGGPNPVFEKKAKAV